MDAPIFRDDIMGGNGPSLLPQRAVELARGALLFLRLARDPVADREPRRVVVARAGSGKTMTLVNRVLFLIKNCCVAPGEMLVLVFNRKAASEIRRRVVGFAPTV